MRKCKISMMRRSGFGALTATALLTLTAAGPATAGDGSVMPNYTFPDGTRGFRLDAINPGLIDPCWLIGFGPLSTPNGPAVTTLDLTQSSRPMFTNTTAGQPFALEFSLAEFGDGSVAPPPAPNADGMTSYRQIIGGHTLLVTFDVGPGPVDPASWVGFNPQPDPPGRSFGVDFQFAAPTDPYFTFQVREDGQLLDFALEGVPEPTTWTLLIGGFGLTGAALRARRLRAVHPA